MNPSPDLPLPPKADELIANISKLMAEAELMLSESTSHRSEQRVELLRSRFERVQNRFSDYYEVAKQKIGDSARCTDEAIRAYPYESLAVALGIGVLVGAAVGRSSK